MGSGIMRAGTDILLASHLLLLLIKKENPLSSQRVVLLVAEREGFEPSIQVYARILA